MLWYKAWLETRVRFLICLVGMTALCWYTAHSDNHKADASTPLRYYFTEANDAHFAIAGLWLGAVCLLLMGGLLREKAVGASSFTLALPFSRGRLMGVRIAVGLIEAVLLIVMPSVAVWADVRLLGKPYPISQLWFHFVLILSGGLVAFGIALLIASLVEGEYTAPLVSLGALIVAAFALGDPRVQSLNVYRFMTGYDYFDRATGLLVGPIPWLHAGAFILVAAIITLVAIRVTKVRDF